VGAAALTASPRRAGEDPILAARVGRSQIRETRLAASGTGAVRSRPAEIRVARIRVPATGAAKT
jgi:hypothetical protein